MFANADTQRVQKCVPSSSEPTIWLHCCRPVKAGCKTTAFVTVSSECLICKARKIILKAEHISMYFDTWKLNEQ